jgi:serine/threonine protein kinase
MGVVYEARHIRLNQRLAVKVARPELATSCGSLRAQFDREAAASAHLKSVHVARAIDVDELPNGLPYVVMEYLTGRGLDVELEATGPMAVDMAVDVATQVTDVMAEAHALGIVHRDLKLANLFVSHASGRLIVKVLDFGIATTSSDDGSSAYNGAFIGTPCYMAPEQALGGVGDPRSDVWSLGVILFELLTGHTPFEGSALSVLRQVLIEPVPSMRPFRPELPLEFERSVTKALEREPARRFQTMQEMRAAIAPFLPAQSTAVFLANLQKSHDRVGDILVADGLLTDVDLERALAAQHAISSPSGSSGKLLGRVLLAMGLVAQADLLAALAKQQALPSDDALVDHGPSLGTAPVPRAANVARRGGSSRYFRALALLILAVALMALTWMVGAR